MRKLTAAALGLLALVAVSLPAQAGHRRSCCNECAPECSAPTTVAWVDKEVTCYKTEWKERDVTCNVMRAHYKDVVETHKCNVCVPVWTEKKEKVWVCNMVAREVVRDVTRCRMERTCCTDPCTGCTHTVCKPVTYVEQGKCTVWENHPIEKEVTVKVCSYKTEEKTYQRTHP